jgi:hypothetical protein
VKRLFKGEAYRPTGYGIKILFAVDGSFNDDLINLKFKIIHGVFE